MERDEDTLCGPPRVVVFMPAHNEGQTIAKMLAGVKKALGRNLVGLVVVNDGSTDDTEEVARKYTSHIVATQAGPLGNGAAVKTALEYIEKSFGDSINIVARIDSDGQHDPMMLVNLIALIEVGATVAYGSRFHPDSDTSEAMPDRLMTNGMIANLVTLWLGTRVTDARTGLEAFRWGPLRRAIPHLRTVGYGSPIELLMWMEECCLELDLPFVYRECPIKAMYSHLQPKLENKYVFENLEQKADRLRDGYLVYLYARKFLEPRRVARWGSPNPRPADGVVLRVSSSLSENALSPLEETLPVFQDDPSPEYQPALGSDNGLSEMATAGK